MTPGLYDLPRSAYDAADGVNFSTLKYFARSAAHYRHALLQPHEDTDALALGRAVHLAVFEPEQFRSRVVRWDGGTRRGREWEAFRSEFRERDILRDADYQLCLDLAGAARADATAGRYLSGGRPEVTMFWEHERPSAGALPGWSMRCRGRVDFLSTEGAICDLKTTRDSSPIAFGRQAASLGYHVQAAWYVDGHEAATGKRLPFVVVAIEKAPPFAVAVYEVPEELLALGRETYRGWLSQLRVCREESRWPGYGDGPMQLQLPRWAMPGEDDSADDLGLGFTTDKESTDGAEF